MRNVLTHLYEPIDLDRVTDPVDPALALHCAYADWVVAGLGSSQRQP